jgi:hypothetical protein
VIRLFIAFGALAGVAHGRAQEPDRVPVAPAPPEVPARADEWSPLELATSGGLRVRGTLAGHEVDMLLDCGAGISVVDRVLARRLGLRPSAAPPEGGAGAGGPRFIEALELAIGPARFTLPRALVLDVVSQDATPGMAAVVLGRELFERFVVDVDLPNGRIALRAPGGFAYSGPGATLALVSRDTGELLVDASVDDLPPCRFRLDTGGRALELESAFVRRHELLRGRAPTSQAVAGDGSAVRVASLRSFTLAGQRFERVPALFLDDGHALADDGGEAGSIGADVLGRFRAIIDSSRDRIHLEPDPAPASRSFPRDRLGLAVALRADAFEVTFVAPGSPAAKAGWEPGERIIAWDQQRAGPASWHAFAQRREAPVGSQITLTDGEGRVRVLVAADFY